MHPFGALASPFIAHMIVKINAYAIEDKYPQVAKEVFEPFHVDDVLLGS